MPIFCPERKAFRLKGLSTSTHELARTAEFPIAKRGGLSSIARYSYGVCPGGFLIRILVAFDTSGAKSYIPNPFYERTTACSSGGRDGRCGIEMIKTLERRNFPTGKLTLLASARSVGKKLKFRGEDVAVRELTKDSFPGIDIALFSAGGSISKEYAAHRSAGGCVVIDNSSAFRMDEKVPLVVPEINASRREIA